MLNLIVVLVIIGVALYLLQLLVPMNQKIMQVIYVLVGLVVLVMVLQLLGVNLPVVSALRL